MEEVPDTLNERGLGAAMWLEEGGGQSLVPQLSWQGTLQKTEKTHTVHIKEKAG